jgi:hypothetical protein
MLVVLFFWPIGSYTYSNDYFSFQVPNDFIIEQDFVRYTAPDGGGEDVSVEEGYGVYLVSFKHKIFDDQVGVTLLSTQDVVGAFNAWDKEELTDHYRSYPGMVTVKDIDVSSVYPSVMVTVNGPGNSLYDLRFAHEPYKTSINAITNVPFYEDWYAQKRLDSFYEAFITSFKEQR